MCPACLTTVALILAGATTTGGVTAVLAKKLRKAKRVTPSTSIITSKQKEYAS